MVATWGWRVATISGVQLPWNVDQAVSETHELRQVSAGQCVGRAGPGAREGTHRHRHQHPDPAAPPQEPSWPWGEHQELGISSPVTQFESQNKLGKKIWGREELSDDTVRKSKWAGEKFGDGISLWWHGSKIKVSSATGTLLGPRG